MTGIRAVKMRESGLDVWEGFGLLLMRLHGTATSVSVDDGSKLDGL